MDIFAHAMWAGVGVSLARRRWIIPTRTMIATVVLATLPDIFHLLPVAGWWVLDAGSLNAIWAYAVAIPGQEPPLPPLVAIWSHHLHCITHSAIVAGAVTFLV